ncbi:hypothetical protein [Bosea caraganae]|nr:hypothetical protein [Bosea caraganae]
MTRKRIRGVFARKTLIPMQNGSAVRATLDQAVDLARWRAIGTAQRPA